MYSALDLAELARVREFCFLEQFSAIYVKREKKAYDFLRKQSRGRPPGLPSLREDAQKISFFLMVKPMREGGGTRTLVVLPLKKHYFFVRLSLITYMNKKIREGTNQKIEGKGK